MHVYAYHISTQDLDWGIFEEAYKIVNLTIYTECMQAHYLDDV